MQKMPKKATIVSGIALVLLLVLIFSIIAMTRPGAKNDAGRDSPEALPKRISVLFPELNEIRMMDYDEFLSGCVAGMLPDDIDIPPEALKAVAIAENSRAAYFLKNRDPSRSFGADLSVSEDFPFIECENKEISRIVKELPLLTYYGEPVNAQTCKISAGVTDKAAPYSPSVPLLCDVSAKGYYSSIPYTYESVRRALRQNAVSRNFEEWFHDPVYAETGTLIYIGFCDTKVTGKALKLALGLRSTAITVEYREEKFYFTCKGVGENRGMSINAAIFLAQNGKTTEEILNLFYPECAIRN